MEFFDDEDDESIDATASSASIIEFNRETALQTRPNTCGVLAFHSGTEDMMFNYIMSKKDIHSSTSDEILKYIDEYCYSRHWQMHIGDLKGEILRSNVAKVCNGNEICVEIGSYCGYSAVIIASKLSSSGHLFCIDSEVQCIEWTEKLLAVANLSHKVTTIHCTTNDDIGQLLALSINQYHSHNSSSHSNHPHIDLLFIDHDKQRYAKDLILIEAAHLLRAGSVVIADNVLSFGKPLTEYLDHVRDKSLYASSDIYESTIEYSSDRDALACNSIIDGVEVSVYK